MGFSTEKDANCIGNNVLLMVNTIRKHYELDTSKLNKILISYDFASALQRITSEYNHNSPSSFTDCKQGMAIGHLVSRIGANGLCDEYTLVLFVNFFVECFDEDGIVVIDKESLTPIVHRLHHELLHVHEKNTLTCLDQS